MSDCGHRRSELVELLREELPAGRRRGLLEHVEGCEACAAELEALTETWDGLPSASAAATQPPPAGLRERVLAHARDAAPRRTTRAVLLGGLGALGGYLILSLLHPIPSTVEFCQLRIFRDPAMSLGQICLVYAAVSALYAGLPVAAAAWWSAPPDDGWRIGLAEAAVFTLLALPVLGLQFGMEEVAITATVLAGIALGAAAGGVAGALARRSRRTVPAGG